MKPSNSPTQGHNRTQEKIGQKVAFGPLFPTAYNFSWVGIGFIQETDYKKPNPTKFSANTLITVTYTAWPSIDKKADKSTLNNFSIHVSQKFPRRSGLRWGFLAFVHRYFTTAKISPHSFQVVCPQKRGCTCKMVEVTSGYKTILSKLGQCLNHFAQARAMSTSYSPPESGTNDHRDYSRQAGGYKQLLQASHRSGPHLI